MKFEDLDIKPKCKADLHPDFVPAVLVHQKTYPKTYCVPVSLERPDGSISRHDVNLFSNTESNLPLNIALLERTIKTLLWQRGGHSIVIGDAGSLGHAVQDMFSKDGLRKFDVDFMGDEVFLRTFNCAVCSADLVPLAHERPHSVGRHLKGHRVGFDLGASDRKSSAVSDGHVIYSEEVPWHPSVEKDPIYHYREIRKGIEKAAQHLPKLDAIGGSSAGVYVDNEPRVASLYRGVASDKRSELACLFTRLSDDFGVPLTIMNDGDVSALAGSMALKSNSVLGLALGSSLAAGYVNDRGEITGWLNELAFAPFDYAENAWTDDWSGDRGCGASYLSQQAIFRLAPKVGIDIDPGLAATEKLRQVQQNLEAGGPALNIWRNMSVFLGYAVAHYASFYDIHQVLLLGRCTSGTGGSILMKGAQEVLNVEFPELAKKLSLSLPDEKSRRVGQAIAAASLPILE